MVSDLCLMYYGEKFKGWQLPRLMSKNSNVSSKGSSPEKKNVGSFNDGPLLEALEFFENSHGS